jgi:hypothetical protein
MAQVRREGQVEERFAARTCASAMAYEGRQS